MVFLPGCGQIMEEKIITWPNLCFSFVVWIEEGHIAGKSTRNQHIKRLWRDVFEKCLCSLYNKLEDQGVLDVECPLQLFCLHYVYLPRIQVALDYFREAWNNHLLSSAGNHSPLQRSMKCVRLRPILKTAILTIQTKSPHTHPPPQLTIFSTIYLCWLIPWVTLESNRSLCPNNS